MRRWQQEAVDTVADFVTNHAEDLNELAPSTAAGDWPEEVTRAHRSMYPSVLVNAIRITLTHAAQGALDPRRVDNPTLAEEMGLQQQAIDMVGDLLGMQGDELVKVVNIDISSKL
jgi:hypothetical protein